MTSPRSWKRLLLGGAALACCLAWGVTHILLFPRAAPFLMPLLEGEHEPQECRARIDALVTRLKPFADAGLSLPVHVDLPRVVGEPSKLLIPILEVRSHEFWFAGEKIATDAATAGRKVGEWMAENGASLEPGPALYLAADRELRMRQLAPLLQATPEVRVFLVTLPPILEFEPPLGARQFASDFEKAHSNGERAALASSALSVLAGLCKPLAQRLAGISEVVPEERATAMLSYVEEGLRECNCGRVDLDALEYVLLRTYRAEAPPPTALEIPSPPSGDLEGTVEQFARNLVATPSP